jgi:hypothetical protein
MISSIFDSLFGCSHRRLTRPVTPVSKPGVPSGETYVVCLDCGKQFAYDWNHMRMGKPIERSPDTGVLRPDMPGAAKAKIKYALLGSALPLAVLLGSTLATKRRARTGVTSQGVTGTSGPSTDLDQHIELPHARPVVRFRVRELINHIEQSGRAYIVVGDVDCALADHPKPSSLDYWLRENFAKNKDRKQATNEVITQLVVTGLFEQSDGLRCPDSGQKCKGLRLVSRVGNAINEEFK